MEAVKAREGDWEGKYKQQSPQEHPESDKSVLCLTLLYFSDLLDRRVATTVCVSDKLFSHDALLCLRTVVKYLPWRKRQSSRGKKQERVSYLDKRREEEKDSDNVEEEKEVIVTTARWKKIEGDWKVAGLSYCSLTTWQSSVD